MTHVRSSASFLGVPLARKCVRAYIHVSLFYVYIHEMLGAYAYSSLPFAHRHWRRMVGHNAETNRVPRRIYIYVYASERSGVHAYRLVSIYTRPGVSDPPAEKGPTPLSAWRTLCSCGLPSKDRHLLSLTRLSRFTYSLVFLSFSLFFFERRLIDGSKEDMKRRRTVTRISGLTNFVTKWATQYFTRYMMGIIR